MQEGKPFLRNTCPGDDDDNDDDDDDNDFPNRTTVPTYLTADRKIPIKMESGTHAMTTLTMTEFSTPRLVNPAADFFHK